MTKKKILITVTTYPLPSRSYDELVCTAGFLEDGSWIRIYPIPLSFLNQIKKDTGFKKYTWIELDVKKRTDDFRPESYSPANYNFKKINTLDTSDFWEERKNICLKNVYTNKTKLINDSKDPTNISLVTFKPSKITGFEYVNDSKEWKDEWIELRKQTDLFAEIETNPEKLIQKVPYKFYYIFEDDEGVSSKLMIEDWEIFQLYLNCLRDNGQDQEIALKKVKEQYFDKFTKENEIYLFLGTTMQWHRRRSTNPFVIIGVFYPKIKTQYTLF
ncbi:hypothetical protein [Flavobacterium sp.]|uniref:hypothetical protein n=1 Tax=Flavobacterium sp. TaxID=239 RepID=UPI00261FB78D|nr:hypothetical protein [Flavobacterium sp.]MDG2431920.1 hypothetical protein [Flavobacterium sp.]